jgi:hypothetical protein
VTTAVTTFALSHSVLRGRTLFAGVRRRLKVADEMGGEPAVGAEDGRMAQMGHGDARYRHDCADRLDINLDPWRFRTLDSLEKKSIVEQFVAFVKGPI